MQFSDNAFFSQVYRVKLDRPLFTGKRESELLFLGEDLDNTKFNNEEIGVKTLNNELNYISRLLSKKGIKLIVLPSPDKYDIYYEFILNKKYYPKPLFFNILNQLNKEYLYVDSKEILGSAIKNKKDIYFYDDTHWSPWASQLIAKELAKLIK